VPLRRADEILDWLLARQPDERFLEKTTRLPYGWGLWLRALVPLPRPSRASAFIAELSQRPLPVAGGRLPQLGFAQALRRLFWQGWEPAPRDQRWMRWSSALLSALLHLLFALFLLWVALIRPPVEPQEGGEGSRVQVEFVGRGTPQDEGGGDAAGAQAAAAADTQAASSTASAASAASAAEASAPPAPATAESSTASTPPPPTAPSSEPVPAPPTPAPPAVESPVQATTVVEATTDFVVPPPTVPRTEVRVVPRPAQEIMVREREVQVVQAPRPAANVSIAPAAAPQIRAPEITVREREVALPGTAPAPVAITAPRVDVRLPTREVQVRERDIQPLPSAAVAVAAVPQREVSVPARSSPELAVRERAIPNAAAPARSDASATAAATAAAASSRAPATAPARSGPPAARANSAQAGARPAADPGNWATPARGDEWGAASQARDGQRGGAQASRDGQGLFNGDGSIRVPGQEGDGDSARGAPGGENDGWTRDRIAQSGTWLKRPPYDYTPTSFDKYWAPNESLLAEWVRKGIKAVEIPIPGSSSKISCVVSILQFGGGCGLTDPNMNDQPAVARPPPDIPFKKDLQEDNGSR